MSEPETAGSRFRIRYATDLYLPPGFPAEEGQEVSFHGTGWIEKVEIRPRAPHGGLYRTVVVRAIQAELEP